MMREFLTVILLVLSWLVASTQLHADDEDDDEIDMHEFREGWLDGQHYIMEHQYTHADGGIIGVLVIVVNNQTDRVQFEGYFDAAGYLQTWGEGFVPAPGIPMPEYIETQGYCDFFIVCSPDAPKPPGTYVY